MCGSNTLLDTSFLGGQEREGGEGRGGEGRGGEGRGGREGRGGEEGRGGRGGEEGRGGQRRGRRWEGGSDLVDDCRNVFVNELCILVT